MSKPQQGSHEGTNEGSGWNQQHGSSNNYDTNTWDWCREYWQGTCPYKFASSCPFGYHISKGYYFKWGFQQSASEELEPEADSESEEREQCKSEGHATEDLEPECPQKPKIPARRRSKGHTADDKKNDTGEIRRKKKKKKKKLGAEIIHWDDRVQKLKKKVAKKCTKPKNKDAHGIEDHEKTTLGQSSSPKDLLPGQASSSKDLLPGPTSPTGDLLPAAEDAHDNSEESEFEILPPTEAIQVLQTQLRFLTRKLDQRDEEKHELQQDVVQLKASTGYLFEMEDYKRLEQQP